MTIRTLLNTTWLIKESSLAYSAATYSVNFSSRDVDYTSLVMTSSKITYGSTDVNTQADGWVHEGYRLITITGGTDVANANLIAWLQANATLMGMQLVTYNALKKFKEEMISFVLSHVGPGYWSPYTAYNAGEVFFYGKMIYVCKANAAAGTLPTNTTYFDPLITNS